MKVRLLFCIILLVISFNQLLAQDPYYVPINIEKGLPSNSIYNILQDSKGFMWFAHDEGLSRYDGYEVKTYYNSSQSSKAGTCINEDKYGRIWYENFDGYVFYIQNDTLHALKHQHLPVGYLEYGLLEDKLCVIANGYVDFYDLKTLNFIRSTEIPKGFVTSAIAANGKYYLSNNAFVYIDSDGKLCKVNNTINSLKVPAFMQRDDEGVFTVARFNELGYCYHIKNDTLVENFKIPEVNYIQAAYFVNACYWFFTTSGVYVYNKEGKILNNGEPYFKEKNIRGVYKDREDNFWFSTASEGVLLVQNIDAKVFFKSLKPNCFDYGSNQLFVGTRNHKVIGINLDDWKTRTYYDGESNHDIFTLKYDEITRSLFITSNEFTSVDLSGKILDAVRIAVKDLVRLDSNYSAYAASGTFGLMRHKESKKSIWDSLFKKSIIAPNSNYSGLISEVRSKSICYLPKKKEVFVITSSGLYKFTSKSLVQITNNEKPIFAKKLRNHGDKLYILQSNGKIITYENGTFDSFLQSKFSTEIQVKNFTIQQNHLLMLVNKSLYYVNLDINMVYYQGSFDEEITDMFIHKQQVLLATSNGIIIQRLNLRTQNPVNPLLNFNSLKVNASLYSLNNATQFKHSQNNIEINYSILCFKTKEEVPLFYRINDGEWIQTQPESRNLNLASLSPGSYKIDFILNSIQENALPLKSITFTIQKPWWQKWWFYLIVIFVFLLIVISIYLWRTNDLIKKNKLATEKMELENALNRSVLTAIKSQMNPHFFHNALNTIQSFIYSNDKKNASTFLNKFSKLTRMILEMSEKDKVTLSEEIASILLYLEIERVRFNDDFEFKIEIQNHIDQEMIKIPSMILQPYIENAIKHGLLHKTGLKKLQIEFKQEEKYLVITIDDNGIGRKRSLELNKIKRDKHQSFSSDANETRLNLLNRGNHRKVLVEYADKYDNHKNPEGTLVTISIPLN